MKGKEGRSNFVDIAIPSTLLWIDRRPNMPPALRPMPLTLSRNALACGLAG